MTKVQKECGTEVPCTVTLVAGMISIVCLVLPNVAYYFFIVVLLAWILVTAIKLRDSSSTKNGE